MIKVVVVDDHAVVREGLKRIIAESGGMIVSGEAADGEFKYETYDIPNHKGKSHQSSFRLCLGQEQPRSLFFHRRNVLSAMV